MNIYIPTYKRAHLLEGKDYFKSAKYVIPESQRDDYRKTLPAKRIIIMPDEFDGNICRKQNWMLRNLDRPYLKMDDDVSAILYIEGVYNPDGKFLKKVESRMLSPDQAMMFFQQGFILAEELGCVYWGINVHEDQKAYRQYSPFSLSHVVLGPFNAHLEHELFYDERMGTKDDYDFSLQALNKYKKILRFNKYSYRCKHGTNPGGLIGYRSRELETKYCEAIMGKWGKKTIKYRLPGEKMTDLLNGIVSIPIRGV